MSHEKDSEINIAECIEKSQSIKGHGSDIPLLLQKFSGHFIEILRAEDGTVDAKLVERHGQKHFQLYIRPIINGVGCYYLGTKTRNETRTNLIINYNIHELVIELKTCRGNSNNTKGKNQLLWSLELYKSKRQAISFHPVLAMARIRDCFHLLSTMIIHL